MVKLPPGNQFGRYFERDDGQRYDIGSADANLEQQITNACWTGAQVQVWGQLFTGVPATQARHIEVEHLQYLSGPAEEPRNLTPFASASASSVYPSDKGGSYYAGSAIDGNLGTPWVEGVAGPGTGEWIVLTFPEPIQVYSIGLDVGYDRDQDIFFANNRIKQTFVIFSDGLEIELAFSDRRGMQTIPLANNASASVETSSIRIVLGEVYPGSRYDDTCLGEVEVWGATQ